MKILQALLSMAIFLYSASLGESNFRTLTKQQLTQVACAEFATSIIFGDQQTEKIIFPTESLRSKILQYSLEFKKNDKAGENSIPDLEKYRPLLKVYRSLPATFNEFKVRCNTFFGLRLKACFSSYQTASNDHSECVTEASTGGDYTIMEIRDWIAQSLLTERSWWPKESDTSIGDDPLPSKKLLDFGKLIQLAKAQATIGSLLHAIYRLNGANFDQIAMVHHSESLQGSSWLAPRVIVALGRASLLFSFNGNPKDYNYSNLEVINFDQKTSMFQFRTIIFKKERTGREIELSQNEIEFENKNVQISKANPKVCISCHGKDSISPNWDSYSIWPGFYGAYHEGMSLPAKERSMFWDFDVEKKYFQLFLDGPAKEGRYSALNARKDSYQRVSSATEYLTSKLSKLNHRRVQRMILDTPKIKIFAPAILALNYCRDYRTLNFIPFEKMKILPLKIEALKNLKLELTESLHSYFRARLLRNIRLLGADSLATINPPALERDIETHTHLELWGLTSGRGEMGDIPPLVGLVNIVRGLGGKINWSTGFMYPGDPKLNFSFYDGESGSEILTAGLVTEIVKRKWVSPVIVAAIKSKSANLCGLIEKESQVSIAAHLGELN